MSWQLGFSLMVAYCMTSLGLAVNLEHQNLEQRWPLRSWLWIAVTRTFLKTERCVRKTKRERQKCLKKDVKMTMFLVQLHSLSSFLTSHPFSGLLSGGLPRHVVSFSEEKGRGWSWCVSRLVLDSFVLCCQGLARTR